MLVGVVIERHYLQRIDTTISKKVFRVIEDAVGKAF